MDTMVVVALVAYVVLFCMTAWVVHTYLQETKAISKRLKRL
jgi:hypothetical protein